MDGGPTETATPSSAASEPTSAAIEERWASLRERLPSALAKLEPAALDATFEHPRRGAQSGRQLLLGAAQHAAVHLGHAQLTRDLLAESA